MTEQVNARLKSALEGGEPQASQDAEEAHEIAVEEPEFVPREVEALNIVKAIIANTVDVRRIGLRSGSGSYCTVLLHRDTAREDSGVPLCRLWVREERYNRIRLADGNQQETLDDLDSIYNYTDGLRRLASESDIENGAVTTEETEIPASA